MTKGLYIHIPFCKSKCSYCDFYSGAFSDELKERYVDKLCEEITEWGRINTCPIDSVYFGGGTPSQLSGKHLARLVESIRSSFKVTEDAEITAEVNPGDSELFLRAAADCGVNRISLGVQSANESELRLLGRRHSFSDAADLVRLARRLGIRNISADIMIGLPDSSKESLKRSIDAVLSLETEHISSYILKLEEGTPLASSSVSLPDDDEVAEQYLFMSECFGRAGYLHYEISNFAKEGFESRHNTKYWRCEEYIGIGPSAHSFFKGERLYYPHSIEEFIKGTRPVFDCRGGDSEEFIMLALRLSRGLRFSEYEERFGPLPEAIIKRAAALKEFCRVDKEAISLTDRGMLLSNSVITNLLEVL